MNHRSNSFLSLGFCVVAFAATAAAQNIFTIDTTADTIDANPGDGVSADALGNSSLRAAIQEANALGGSSVIVLRAGARYALTRMGAGEDAAATGDLDVAGATILIQGNQATVDAADLDRAFDVAAGARLGVNELHVINGFVREASGGAFRSAGELLLFRSTVVDGVAVGTGASGGGIFNSAGLLAVDESTIESCEADRAGGAIEANAGITWVHRSDSYDNRTGPNPGNGGAIHLTGGGFVDVDSSDFRGNSAAREGGALWNSSTGFTIVELCDVDDNVSEGTAADDGGGGLFNDGGAMVVSRTSVTRNRAVIGAGSGGGIFDNDGELLVFLSRIEDNSASRAGGGIESLAGDTNVWGSTLSRNRTGAAPGNGGGLHLTGASQVTMNVCSIEANDAASEGGGLWNSATGQLTVTSSSIRNNLAPSGPDVFNDGGTFLVDGVPVPVGP